MAATGTMSDALAHEVLNASLNDGSFTTPTNIYLALSEANITSGMTADLLDEPADKWTNYARVEILASALSAAGSRKKSNSSEIDFGTATTTEDVTIVDWAIVMTASGAGRMQWFGTFDTPVIIQNGNPVKFAVGDLVTAILATEGTPP